MASTFSSVKTTSFRPESADWDNPRDLGKCAQWLYGMKTLKEPLERQTARNIAFYRGDQHYEWDWRNGQMRLPPEKREEWLLQFNMVKFLLQQKLAKMTRLDPVWTVPSWTSDEYDQVVARFSNDIMAWYWTDGLRMSEKVRDMHLWQFLSPVVFLHPHWNPTAGDSVEVKFEDWQRPIEPGTPPDLVNKITMEDRKSYERLKGYTSTTKTVVQHTGDAGFEIVDVFRAMWYPFFAPSWTSVHYFLKTDVLPIEDVAARYGLSIEDVKHYGRSSYEMSQYHRMLQGWSSPFGGNPQEREEFTNGIMVHQLYLDKVVAPPHGRTAIVLGNGEQAVLWSTLGNKYNDMPFRPICEHQIPGVIWGSCTANDLIPAQVELNLAKNQLANHRQNAIEPRIIRYQNDGADDEMFKADNNDAIIEVRDKNVKPDILFMPSYGLEQETAVAFDMRYMHDAAAVPDVSLGNTSETNAKSGIAIRSLQEEANERLRIQGERTNELMSWVGSFILGELQEKAVRRRLVPLVGDNNSIEYVAWSRAMLRPTIYDQFPGQTAIVRVTAFSNIPMTPTESRRTVLELTNSGYLRPGEHDNVIANVFGMNDLRTTLDKGRADRDKQEREISQWRMGQSVPMPARTDNHPLHEEVMGPWMKSEEYRQTVRRYPWLEQEIQEHYDGHSQGKYDDKARTSYQMQFAQMREGSHYMLKALQMGRQDWAAIFASEAGLTIPGLNGIPPAAGPGGLPDSAVPQQGTGSPGSPSAPSANTQPTAGAQGGSAPVGGVMSLPPLQDTGLAGTPGEPLDGSNNDPRAGAYAAQGDAAQHKRRPVTGKDRDGTPQSITG